jgi:predicted SprT family Zn-dependent metalloprotease
MTLSSAKELAIKLMTQHGLIQKGWTLDFDNAKKRLGLCSSVNKKIVLSSCYVLLNEEHVIKNTILHEIAHALVGCEHGHDNVWKRKAIEIGCDGNRCASSKVVTVPQTKYTAICKKCGHAHNRHRMPKKTSSCGACSNTFDPERILVYKQNY